jgi:hypothetical protein
MKALNRPSPALDLGEPVPRIRIIPDPVDVRFAGIARGDHPVSSIHLKTAPYALLSFRIRSLVQRARRLRNPFHDLKFDAFGVLSQSYIRASQYSTSMSLSLVLAVMVQ